MHPKLVAIVGGSASGKTWLADHLSSQLAGLAARVSLDDFYRDLGGLASEIRSATNFDHPESIDWPLFSDAISRLAAGNSVDTPGYSFESHARGTVWRRCDPMALVLVDGLWLLHPSAPRLGFERSVYVDCPASVRLARRVERDQRERGRKPESIRAQFASHVEPMHVEHVEPQRNLAHLVLTSPPDPEAVVGLVQELRNLAQTPEAA